jgi:hypothetical protein
MHKSQKMHVLSPESISKQKKCSTALCAGYLIKNREFSS